MHLLKKGLRKIITEGLLKILTEGLRKILREGLRKILTEGLDYLPLGDIFLSNHEIQLSSPITKRTK